MSIEEERKARHARKNREASEAVSVEVQTDRRSFLIRLGASEEQLERGGATSQGYNDVVNELKAVSTGDFSQELARIRHEAQTSIQSTARPTKVYDLPAIDEVADNTSVS